MARHSHRARRRPVPWDLVGWWAFACVAGAAATGWFTRSWVAVLVVLAVGALGLGAVTVAMGAGSRRPGPPPPVR